MTVHISARLAWHNDGWNGHICRNPAANTYCVGPYSYPGSLIAERRQLEWEKENAGCACGPLDRVPPCCFSCNAFGSSSIQAELAPPTWWDSGKTRRWEVPPSTVCIWPYEEMYREEAHSTADDSRIYDYDRRLEFADEYFKSIQANKSLVFYYANYSNPFSESESRRYVLVGLSRVKIVGGFLYYEGCSEDVRKRYAGGFVWQRAITSHYPDEGLRIPFHLLKSQPGLLKRVTLHPENPRLFKYATRRMSDDDALGLVEAFLEAVHILQESGDTSEDWGRRAEWLENLIGELWHHRGLFPGMPAVLTIVGLPAAIPIFKDRALHGEERAVWEGAFAVLTGRSDRLCGKVLPDEELKTSRRQWKLRTSDQRQLLEHVLPNFGLGHVQMQGVLEDNRAEHGIEAELKDIAENPYLMAEQYIGNDPDDLIPWGTIDRGMIPSLEFGAEPLAEVDDPRRFRSLLVESLRRTVPHVFSPAVQIIDSVNRRLSVLPEWKRHVFHERYLEADPEVLDEAIVQRDDGDTKYLYLRRSFDNERLIEEKLRFLLDGPDIGIKLPVTERTWESYLYNPSSDLAKHADIDYREAIKGQVAACQRIFSKPLSVLAGAAGTGKTTVIRALIKAIKKGHGSGTPIIALAPTGKAADRVRDMLEGDDATRGLVDVATLHSFLAREGWLNPNMSFKQHGGKKNASLDTVIIDECSMLDLDLTATFFRAVNWYGVRRLILVGDPNQLPPIGRGRVFADVIDYLLENAPEHIATLSDNLRQLENTALGRGTGILELADLYIRSTISDPKDEESTTRAEIVLQSAQDGGNIDDDLRVLYWSDPEDLAQQLISQIDIDLVSDHGSRGANRGGGVESTSDLWRQALEERPECIQIITPYRGDLFGTESINLECQRHSCGDVLDRVGGTGGITLFDKVIQIRNRPRSYPIKAMDTRTGRVDDLEIFNGQLGFVMPFKYDERRWGNRDFRLERFDVIFSRRENHRVGFGSHLGKGCPNESVEGNLELAYAISVHKAQGSEFSRTYVVIPKEKARLLSRELFYTALTRASRHCTLLIQQDISPLLEMRRPHKSYLELINSSLFEFRAVPEALLSLGSWYEEGKIHETLAEVMVRSKSEVIIANMLHEREIPFTYENPLYAPDGTFYLPDFTVTWRGEKYFWEHVGMLHRRDYRQHWEKKRTWYEKFFPGKLIITEESGHLSLDADEVIRNQFR